MSRHDIEIYNRFVSDMQDALNEDEQTFQTSVNRTVEAVEIDDSYSTKEKLNIYADLSSLCNCEKKERSKWVKKASRRLK